MHTIPLKKISSGKMEIFGGVLLGGYPLGVKVQLGYRIVD
jgi:hypothetical protein